MNLIENHNNKLKIFSIYIFLIAVLPFISCEELTYTPTGQNQKNIDPPNTSMEINLENIGDTVICWGTTTFSYTFNTYGKTFNYVELYLDSELVALSRSLTLISFDSRNYADGEYIVTLLLSAQSGSGSLADKLGSEYVVLAKRFVMVIQNEIPPTPLIISNIETRDGYTKLTWPKYKFSNFESYRVYSTVYAPPYNYSSEYFRTEIQNQDSTVWIDNIYTGGQVVYTIDVKTKDGIIFGSPYQYESGTASIIDWQDIDGDNVKIIWNRCKTDSTFEKYELYKQPHSSSSENYTLVATISNINDTVFTTEIGFGLKLDFFVKTVSKHSINYFDNSFSKLETIYIGQSVPVFNKLEYIPATNSIYLSAKDSSFRLDAATNQILAKSKYGIDVCFDGTRGYAYKDLSQVVEIDPISLNEIRTINLQDLLINNDRINKIFTGTANVIYCNTNTEGILMIDSDTHEIITQSPPQTYNPYIFQSSPHGYLIHGSNSTYYNNGLVIKINLDINPIVYNGLYVNDRNKLSFSYYENLDMIIDTYASRIWTATHNGNDYVTYLIFDIPQEIRFPERDPITGMIGGFTTTNKFVIYDVNTQNEFKSIKLSSGFGGKIFLFDSKAYSTEGTYIELN